MALLSLPAITTLQVFSMSTSAHARGAPPISRSLLTERIANMQRASPGLGETGQPSFSAYDNFVPSQILSNMRQDCIVAYGGDGGDSQSEVEETSSIHSGDYHNSGNTHFIRASDAPRCLLESFALDIFQFHTRNLKKTFDPEKSGSEWWCQVVDSSSTIGFHWDRDYGKEDEEGINVYPNLATVTYLTLCGGPTLIMNKVGLPKSKDDHSGSCDEIFISSPRIGKHIAFDGKLLHAAPSDFVNGGNNKSRLDEKDEQGVFKRITFLVNIWLDNKPEQAKELSSELLKHFTHLGVPLPKSLSSKRLKIDVPCHSVSQQLILGAQIEKRSWNFVNGGRNHTIDVLVPDNLSLLQLCSKNHVFRLTYAGSGLEVMIRNVTTGGDDYWGDEDGDYEQRDVKRRRIYWRPYDYRW